MRAIHTMRMMLIGLLAAAIWATPTAGQPNFDDMPEVIVSAKASGQVFVPGQRGFLVVVLDHGEELHSWPSIEQDVLPKEIAEFAIRTQITVEDAPNSFTFGPVQWPEPGPAMVPSATGGGAVEALTYKHRALAYIPFLVASDAVATDIELKVVVDLQACDESVCYLPQHDVRTVQVSIADESGGQLVDPDFDGFDAGVFDTAEFGVAGEMSQTEEVAAGIDEKASAPSVKFLGLFALPKAGSSSFLVALALAGAVGGFVLNLTPCVLPVIPIKVLTLTQHAGESRVKAAMLGLWMALGVVAFWSLLSIPVVLVKGFADPSIIFGIWWLTGGIGLIIVVMSTGLMGLFNISLPQKAYMINPKADSPQGSFVFGMMTAVLGLPCFGFVVGALLPAATAAGSATVVTVFVSMGVGMALPYLVLAMFPGLLKKVPKTGPASDLVKQVMGLMLMAAGVYFIGAGLLALVAEHPHLAKVLHWWAAGFFIVAAGVWLVVRTITITKKTAPRVVFTIVALLLSSASMMVAYNQTMAAKDVGAWIAYSDEAFEAAMDDGQVVVLDFTAEWCLNCKALEAAVLNVDPVKSRLMASDVVAFKVDLTARSAPGWAKLKDLGQTGIPTLAIFGPGTPQGPWVANVYGREQVVNAINKAGGGAEISSR